LRELKADIVDEHSYAKPEWFFNNTHRFDNYDPKGPKVFFGEYAAQSDKIVSVLNRNNLECAISEAAFMTGMERNAEVVRMASCALLFAHIDGWQWTPNLIWTDNLSSYGTPNYYVQQLFALNRGDVVLPVKLDPVHGRKLYASAEVKFNLSGNARLTVLTGSRADENSFTEPTKVSPKESPVKLSTDKPVTLPANSLTVLRVAVGK
jgi:alpha-N-arabinofuranosidase